MSRDANRKGELGGGGGGGSDSSLRNLGLRKRPKHFVAVRVCSPSSLEEDGFCVSLRSKRSARTRVRPVREIDMCQHILYCLFLFPLPEEN